ncbi:methyl farnesoate epoxidase-like [Amphibalanus amphitrite]|uniref:methyl farnesoate epoxidase-like n=1 Tax=Amphibalanus amphitrite TaxID=1232801 RepID=UPI001C8FFFD9|nr:methyl farnesoate epoxidase-like [Amphibalanus amphitrite]
MIADEFDNMVKHMLPNCGKPVTMRFYLDLAAINVIWRMFTGSRLDGASPQTHEMMTLAAEAFQALGPQNPVTVLPWLRHVMPRWSSHAALLRYRDSFEPLLRDLILKHRQRKDHTSPPDFIDLFLAERESTDSAGCSDSESHLIAMGMDFFEAGLTTTSVTLLWTLLLLVLHPDIQSRAQQEIDRVLNGQRPCFSDRARLPYVQAVLMEASRVASVIPQAVPHRAVADVSLRGHRIPRGTMILLHLWAVHADAAHWGDPHRFRPERFLTAEGEVRQDDHLMPFGSGRRICLGETVARTELFVLCVSLLQKFRFAAAPGQVLTLESSFFELRRPMDFSVIYETR